MDSVEYRPLQNEDIDALGAILGDIWHSYTEGRKRIVSGIIDLANFAQRNTFAEVAVAGGSPVGVIMARAGLPSKETQERWSSVMQHACKKLDELGGSAADLARFFDAMKQADHDLLEQSASNPDFELVLFAVSDSTRGLGIGSTLMKHAQHYLANHGGSKAFILTDTDCSWEYYEHQGMKRVAEQSFADDKDRILPERMFVYEMDLSVIER